MRISQIYSRIKNRYQRTITDLLFRRSIRMHNSVPYISFTFDDFPRSALYIGGGILLQFGFRGTYYASFGLMGTEAPTGMIFLPDDIKELVAQGHELGCHTFDHCHSLETSSKVFEDSIRKNKLALDELAPGKSFKTFSYPISVPRLRTKHITGTYFSSCRCGGQTYNANKMDLNLLKAFFLEKSRNDVKAIKEIIDQNCQNRGWLIFATHDISENPTPYGCTPSFFEEIVNYSMTSGARILPISEALDAICAENALR